MNWEQVCRDSSLQDLPYKIELNEWGQIVMSPATNRHGRFQMRIGFFLINLTQEEGAVISECSIQVHRQTKVADVAWCSPQFIEKYGEITPYLEAPEICIEIISLSNTSEEMQDKRELYFEAGAKEVWFCNEEGDMFFYSHEKELEKSYLLPDFPKQIKI